MNRKLFPMLLLVVLSTKVCVAEEDSRLGFPKSSEIAVLLGKQPWISGLRQIPATVIDKGIMRNVPYLSFQSGDYELNVYGDPNNPAGVEIGIYRSLLNDDTAKKGCIEFISKLLPEQAHRTALRNLDHKKDLVTSGAMTVEITPPTDEDAYGGWWVSAYYVSALDYFRASPAEIAAITVPKNIPAASPQADASGWSQSDMKLARPSASPLEISVASITIGGIEYKRARIVKRNPVEATLYHSTGVATYPLEQFGSDIQRQLGYDSIAADTYRMAQAEIQRQIAQRKAEASAPQEQATQSSADYDGQSYDYGRVYVRGYYRQNGTYVHSYTRSR
ncbi:MAG: hypothetical protein ABSD58_09710 [Verrucomicrobiia bacterium]|jgi:hypothetical protein